MHELSIAEALADIVRPHAAGQRLIAVGVRCGAGRAIEPASLQLAWQALTDPTDWHGSTLAIEVLPWHMTCRTCHRHWEDASSETNCTCGSSDLAVHGSNELTLRWIEVDDAQQTTARPVQTGDAK